MKYARSHRNLTTFSVFQDDVAPRELVARALPPIVTSVSVPPPFEHLLTPNAGGNTSFKADELEAEPFAEAKGVQSDSDKHLSTTPWLSSELIAREYIQTGHVTVNGVS